MLHTFLGGFPDSGAILAQLVPFLQPRGACSPVKPPGALVEPCQLSALEPLSRWCPGSPTCTTSVEASCFSSVRRAWRAARTISSRRGL